jgi:hypothetical protein
LLGAAQRGTGRPTIQELFYISTISMISLPHSLALYLLPPPHVPKLLLPKFWRESFSSRGMGGWVWKEGGGWRREGGARVSPWGLEKYDSRVMGKRIEGGGGKGVRKGLACGYRWGCRIFWKKYSLSQKSASECQCAGSRQQKNSFWPIHVLGEVSLTVKTVPFFEISTAIKGRNENVRFCLLFGNTACVMIQNLSEKFCSREKFY